MQEVYHTPKTKTVNIVCGDMITAYDCLKSGCDYAEAWEGTFFCNKPKNTLPFGKKSNVI